MVKIKTLLENRLSQNKALHAEHGLSFYIEYKNKKILFDCSAGGAFLENAEKMNVDPKTVDYVVLSHSHYDHAGGYPELVKAGVSVPLYTGPDFWEEKYASEDGQYVYLGCGFSSELIQKNGIRQIVCQGQEQLLEGCYAVGEFEKYVSFETVPKRFVKDTETGMMEDDFADEICLVLECEKGLVVIVGCSHPGILNMLKTIQKRFQKDIYAVFGGSHLVEADEARINRTMQEIETMGIQIPGFNHCTGELAESYFREHVQQVHFSSLKAGDCYIL